METREVRAKQAVLLVLYLTSRSKLPSSLIFNFSRTFVIHHGLLLAQLIFYKVLLVHVNLYLYSV